MNTLDQARTTTIRHPPSLGPEAADHLFYSLAHHAYLTPGGQRLRALSLESLLDHSEFRGTDMCPKLGASVSICLTGCLHIGLAMVLDQESEGHRIRTKRRGTQIGRPPIEKPADRTIQEIRCNYRHEVLRPPGTHDD